MEIVKGIFGLTVLGLIVGWLFGGVVLLSLVGVAIIGFFILEYVGSKQLEKERAERKAHEEAKVKAREEKLAAMKPHERKNFLKQEAENEEKRVKAAIEYEKYDLARKKRAAEQRELELRERELAVREKAVAEAEKGKKVPLAVKTATAGVVGYKIGKNIAKW
jgi:hypothetical protein